MPITFIPVPECLHGRLAMEIARRMAEHDWQYWLSEELPINEYMEPKVDFQLACQKMLGIKRSHVDCKVCAACGVVCTSRLKCGKCLVTYYCDAVCQRAHWREHRDECRPPSPKVRSEYAVALPDCSASRRYVDACKMSGAMALCVVSREYFEEQFCKEAYLKTLVRLAYSGRTHPYLLAVTYEEGGVGVYSPV